MTQGGRRPKSVTYYLNGSSGVTKKADELVDRAFVITIIVTVTEHFYLALNLWYSDDIMKHSLFLTNNNNVLFSTGIQKQADLT